jgi:hypothetical protein
MEKDHFSKYLPLLFEGSKHILVHGLLANDSKHSKFRQRTAQLCTPMQGPLTIGCSPLKHSHLESALRKRVDAISKCCRLPDVPNIQSISTPNNFEAAMIATDLHVHNNLIVYAMTLQLRGGVKYRASSFNCQVHVPGFF